MSIKFEKKLLHWLPVKLIEVENEKTLIEWLYFDNQKMEEPFFDETVLKIKSHTYNSSRYKVRTDIDWLIDWANTIPSVNLQSMIFHVSRCGSTMISQLLVIPEENIVISEAPILDQILRSETLSEYYKISLIKAVVKFLGYQRFEQQKQLIIKMDAWHLLYIDKIRTIFPETPFFILYRNPEEVLRSHARQRGMHMIPNLLPNTFLGFKKTTTWENLDDYSNAVLQKYYEAILAFSKNDNKVFLSSYDKGMTQVISDFTYSTNIFYDENVMIMMKKRLELHSKNKSQIFEGDKPINIHTNLLILNTQFDLLNQHKNRSKK